MIAPVTIGVSRLEMESYTRRPIPGQENTVSARTEPDNNQRHLQTDRSDDRDQRVL